MSKRILVVDDDDLMREFVAETLRRRSYQVDVAECAETALQKLEQSGSDLMVTDLKMPGIDGLQLLIRAKKLDPEMVVVVMTAYGTIDTAVEAMRNGAYDFITKPFSADIIEVCVQKALQFQTLLRENSYLREEISGRFNQGQMIGSNKKMQQVNENISLVAKSKASVLICGDSGTGKELVARAIHQQSPRANGPFVRINCAAVVESLLESELFGHEKGSFTGANQRRPGRFELADGGTLFLDEIGEMSTHLQAKLLRVLQEKEFERVGGNETIKVDVRIISATNRDIEKEIERECFREDLYYRLNVVPIYLPPLRERKDDIPALLDFFMEKYNRENNLAVRGFTAKALELLCDYPWPGNIRELENLVERMIVLGHGQTIRHSDLPMNVVRPKSRGDIIEVAVGTTVYAAERELIIKTYQSAGGNKTVAAKMLDISVRKLFDRIKEYGVCEDL